jgi:TolA-binding protein
MRIRRGKAEGFKRVGRLFVYPNEQPNAPVRETVRTDEQSGPDRRQASESGRSREPFRDRDEFAGAAEKNPDAGPGGAPVQALPVIIEFQKIELTRLLRDNTRLNQRLDQLMDEIRYLREMQQREQVLRQQDQALRQQTQGMLERLTGRLPPPVTPPATPPAAFPATAPGLPPGASRIPEEDAVSPTTSAAGTAAEAAVDAAPDGAPEPRPGSDEIARSTPAGPDDSTRQEPPYAYAAGDASGAEFDLEPGASTADTVKAAAELAEILREVGESLRDLDAVPARAPEMPAPLSPEVPPEAPPGVPPEVPLGPPAEPSRGPLLEPSLEASAKASAEPGENRSPGAAEAGAEIGPARQFGGAGARLPADLAGPPGDEEGRLLEILGRMGPSAEDRRTAARIMKRLLRSRGASRPREPDS